MSNSLSSVTKILDLVIITFSLCAIILCMALATVYMASMIGLAVMLKLLHDVVDASTDLRKICDRTFRTISRPFRMISRESPVPIELLEAAASDPDADVRPQYWPSLDALLLTLDEKGYQEPARNALKEKMELLHTLGFAMDFKRFGNPLHLAILFGVEGVAEVLIDSNREYNVQDYAGMTPLHYAASYGRIATVKKLLASGVNVRLKRNSGDTALHSALRFGNEGIAVLLAGFDSGNDLQNSDGKTPLHLAAEKGFIRVVRKLLDARAKKHAQDHFGRTPAFYALAYGMEDVAKLLMESDREIDLQDNTGLTPLHIAASESEEAVKKLLFLNAHPHVTANNGYYPLRVAMDRKRCKYYSAKMILSSCAWKGIEIDWEDLGLSTEKTQYCIHQLSECYAEIQRMKGTKFPKTFVSYYDLARTSVVKGTLYLANEDIRNAVSRQDAFYNFPNYAELLSFSVKNAEIRRVLNKQCLEGLSLLAGNLPYLARINILLYLSEQDIRNFIEVFHF